MNDQMERPRGDIATYEQDPLQHAALQEGVGHDDNEHPGEKKSMLKKVKAKAKKIKDSLRGYGGHGNGLDHGHGDHDHDADEDESEEMNTPPEVHASQSFTGERSPIEGGTHSPTNTPKPSDTTTTSQNIPGTSLPMGAPGNCQTFDPNTTSHIPGQEEVIGHSKTDTTGTSLPVGTREDYQTFDPSTKSNTPGQEEILGHSRTDTGGTNFQVDTPGAYQTFDPSIKSYIPGQEENSCHSRTDIGGNNLQGGTPGSFQAFDPSTKSYIPGQEENLGHSRTDTGGTNLQGGTRGNYQTFDPSTKSYIPGQEENLGHSTTNTGGTNLPVDTPGDYQTFDPNTKSYIPGQEEILGHSRTDTGGTDLRVDTPGDYQTFDPSTKSYIPIPGQEETLGHSRTDTGRPMESKERAFEPKNTPVGTHSSGTHDAAHGDVLNSMDVDTGRAIRPDEQTFKVSSDSGTGQEKAKSLVGSEEQSYTQEDMPLSAHPAGDDRATVPGTTEGGDLVEIGDAHSREENLDKDIFPSKDEKEVRDPENYQDKVTSPTYSSAIETQGAGVIERGQHISEGIDNEVEGVNRLEKDHHTPKDEGETRDPVNYESKVIDPTRKGSEAAGVATSILPQLEKTKVKDDSDQKPNTSEGENLSEQSTNRGMTPFSDLKPNISEGENLSEQSTNPGMTPSTEAPDEKLSTGSHDKFSSEPITYETSFVEEVETHAPDAIQTSQASDDKGEQKQASYTEKMSSTASVVVDKAKQATSVVTSKLGYDSSGKSSTTSSKEQHDSEQLQKGSYVGAVSTATSAIADKAVQAKDVVATKLGYGGTQGGQTERLAPNEESSKAGSIGQGEQTEQQAPSEESSKAGYVGYLQEKLAPVYGKVTELGSTVASKVQGTRTAQEQEGGMTENKGVTMKEYLAEALKPGEEHKALSEVITEALPLRKQKGTTSNEGEGGQKSEEAKKHLGELGEMSRENAGFGSTSPGKAVLDKIKGAATSWFGKGGESQPVSQGSKDPSEGNETEKTG